jgi:hypothetical protein
MVYGPAGYNDTCSIAHDDKEKEITIEFLLRPKTDVSAKSVYIFCMFDDYFPEFFSISQFKSFLKISIQKHL